MFNKRFCGNNDIPYLRVYKPHFWQECPPKFGCGLCTEYCPSDDWARDAVLYVVKLPVETASVWDLQAIARAWMRQRITGVSAYFDCMSAANTINSQKLEDRDITDKKP
jgi:hypothetical protein